MSEPLLTPEEDRTCKHVKDPDGRRYVCAACANELVASLRTRLSAAEGERDEWKRTADAAKELEQRHYTELQLLDDKAPRCVECKARLRWLRDGGEWKPQTADAMTAIRCLDCASIMCGPCARSHFSEEYRQWRDGNAQLSASASEMAATILAERARADAAEARVRELEAHQARVSMVLVGYEAEAASLRRSLEDMEAERNQECERRQHAERGWNRLFEDLAAARRSLEAAVEIMRELDAADADNEYEFGTAIMRARAFLATPSPEGKPETKETDRG